MRTKAQYDEEVLPLIVRLCAKFRYICRIRNLRERLREESRSKWGY